MNTERVIKPSLTDWSFREREEQLFESAKSIPTWRLANVARRALADTTMQLANEIPVPEGEEWDDLGASEASKLAIAQLAMIVAREAGAIVALVSTGHERESLVHGRISLECILRARQCRDDKSGEAARAVLKNRAHGSLRSLATKYGNLKELDFYDRFAHASPGTLLVLSPAGPPTRTKEIGLEIRPTRGVAGPANQLRLVAYTAGEAMALLAETFDVAVAFPPYMSGQLIHLRDHPLPPEL